MSRYRFYVLQRRNASWVPVAGPYGKRFEAETELGRIHKLFVDTAWGDLRIASRNDLAIDYGRCYPHTEQGEEWLTQQLQSENWDRDRA